MRVSKVKCPFFYSEQDVDKCTLFEADQQLKHFNVYKRNDRDWWLNFTILPECCFCYNPQDCPKRLQYKDDIVLQRLEDRSF